MRVLAFLGIACAFVTAQSQSEDDIIGDPSSATAPVEIGVGHQAPMEIDCAQTFDCEFKFYDPVCGSDDITYANNCAFASTYCARESDADTLFIQAVGVCPPLPDDSEAHEDESTTDTTGEQVPHPGDQLETNSEVDLSTVFCSLTCKLSPDQVCGTDGITYINDCHLLATKCEHPELEKASHGECAKSEDEEIVLAVLEVDGDTTDEKLTAAPEKCNPMCERVYDPICGSDGVTYANTCLLEYAECRNPSIKAFGPGKCAPHMLVTRSAHTPSNANGGESCVPVPCPYTYAPVCGSDGQTHDNLCLFANARCQHPLHALKLVHDGECDADTQLTCEMMTCPTYTECREQKEPDDTVVAYCADVCSPDRCSEREDCELVDSDCFTAPCSPVAMCIPKVQDE